MSHEYARRQDWEKRKKELIDSHTVGRDDEWENEFDREEIYDNPFGTNND